MSLGAFAETRPLSLGVELELQLVNTHDYDLVGGAGDLLREIAKHALPGEVKPEMTDSMIEMSTGVCENFAEVLGQLSTPPRCAAGRRRATQYRRLWWRHARLSALGRAQDLRQAALQSPVRTLWLSGQTIHHLRPACAYRLSLPGWRALPSAFAVALHPALHRLVRFVAVCARCGYWFPVGTPEFGLRLSAVRSVAFCRILG